MAGVDLVGGVQHHQLRLVQLVNNATATCWTSDFTSSIENTAELFKAKAP